MRLSGLAVLSLLPFAAFAGEGELHVGHGWVAATEATEARVFVGIENEGEAPVTLTGGRAEIAGSVALAAVPVKGDAAHMMLPEYVIAPGAELEMDPEGVYLLLTDLTEPLHEGEEFEIVLTVAPLGEITVEVDVEGPDAESESHAGHNH